MKGKNLENHKAEIKEFLGQRDIDIVGFGKVPDDIEMVEIEGNLPRAIVLGYRLSKAALDTIKDRPTLIYKHHYKTVNWILDQTAGGLANFIQNKGYLALPIPASQTIDWGKQRGHISHKRLGMEAGLGFRGRNGLLVHPEFGSGVRYVSILTDLEFSPDEKSSLDCGACRKCIEVCPANAISEEGCDHPRCFQKLKEFVKIQGVGQYICGVCVRACDGGN